METPSLTFTQLSALTEDQARQYFEGIRWPNGVTCPLCGVIGEATKLQGKSTRAGVYKCRACRKPFTATVGTIFHRSHISLRQWLMAFHLMCASKKGISALQLQRMLDLKSYKSAWHLAHRVRWAMRQEPLQGMLRGEVEADETYVGGKPRNPDRQGDRRRGTWSSKTPVMALVQRDGGAIAFPVKHVNADTLRGAVNLLVEPGSTIYTDEHPSYQGLGRSGYRHETTNHLDRQYLRPGGIHSNTVESYFALLKRGIHGSFHHVSVGHLGRYCDEFSFRWSFRKVKDGERTIAALRQADGKRLQYRRYRLAAGTEKHAIGARLGLFT